jgi:ABC-type sulfate/molybdate transport systems ATPase subunit
MLVEFKNVEVRRDSRTVLSGIDLALTEHRIGIIGPNGSGKSSLIRLVNGLLLPEAGQVLVDGLDTRKDVTEIRRKVGFVFQNPDNQIVFPVVHEDIAFGLKQRLPGPSNNVAWPRDHHFSRADKVRIIGLRGQFSHGPASDLLRAMMTIWPVGGPAVPPTAVVIYQ